MLFGVVTPGGGGVGSGGARSEESMEFHVLGPLEIVRQGRTLELGTGKQRALLAVLLLHRNEVVSSDRLIDALWGETAPATAPKIVQGYVSRLRKLLEGENEGPAREDSGRDAGVLLTRSPGYVLRVDDGQVDADRFAALLVQARAALAAGSALDASAVLREALELWRGPALSEFAFDPFAQEEIARLEELHLAALEERVEADLALGRDRELVAELEALVPRHPLRERLRGQLMLALYRCGRQAEALQVYQDTRGLLLEELGLEPSRSIVELEQAILRQDPALDVLPSAAAQPPPAIAVATASIRGSRADAVFVGRERELAALADALGDVLSGNGRLVVVGGEPGIGKSRLVEELSRSAASNGAEIHWGRCWEEGGAPPYWPWVQVLRACVRERGVEQLADELGPGAAEVAELVPEVRQHLPALRVPPGPTDPKQARFRLFDTVSGFLTRASRTRPLVIVLDDLNWADQGSLLLLEFVARELGETRLLLVGTYRDMGLSRGHPLAQTLGELSRERHFERVLLRGLDHDDVACFVESACGFQPDLALVQAIHAQTEGNPFFVGEVVRLLRDEGALTPEASGAPDRWSARIPDGVREAVGRRLERLSPPCSSTLTVASVVGREFGLDQLAVLLGDLDDDALLEALDEALAAHLVEEVPGDVVRYQFTHALIQATLADELSRTRRARLHARIAETLEKLYGTEAAGHATELAHHFGEAKSVLGTDRFVHYCALAGESALAARAPEHALVHFERALTAKGDGPTDDQAAEVLFGLGRAQLATLGHDRIAPAVASLLRSFDHYVEAGDIPRAITVSSHPLPLSFRFGYTDAAELIARGLSLASPGSPEAGLMLAQHGGFSGFIDGDYRRAQDDFGRALSIAEREGDSTIQRRTLANAAMVDAFHFRWDGCLAAGSRAIELAVEDGDASTEITARRAVVFTLTTTGQREQARAFLGPALAHAEQLREGWWLTSTSFNNEVLALYEGDWSTAREMRDVGLAADSRDPRHLALGAVLESTLGDDDAAAAYLVRLRDVALASPPPGPIADHAQLAMAIPLSVRNMSGDEWLDVAESAARGVLSLSTKKNPVVATCALAGLGLIAVRREDSGSAEKLYDTLATQSGTASFFAPLTFDRMLGLLAATAGRMDAAIGHFADGLAFCDRAGYRTEYAWTAADYADALLEHTGTERRARARALQDEALEVARELGMRPLEERVLARREILEAEST
jgi:DNA-binding SARP family transcriptional activator